MRYEIQKVRNSNSYSLLRVRDASCYNAAAVATTGGTPTPGASSRETRPTHWLRNALPWEPAQRTGSSA
ncbi:MAG: hypothetical protein KME31_20080 [Tolypothrix carrinoi HA7290-LM1]|nr:hypothetical protein [Tolypothrix carrinoi HA7290-LM1]